MNFDLRLPVGLMFTLFGAMLTIYGLVADPAIYKKSLGINVNLGWGLVMLAFGVVMLVFALRAFGRLPKSSSTSPMTNSAGWWRRFQIRGGPQAARRSVDCETCSWSP